MTSLAQSVWVLSPQEHSSSQRGRQYTFSGSRGRTVWPIDRGQRLGAVGMWNFLWRLGFHPQFVSINSISNADVRPVLFADLESAPPDLIAGLRRWADQDAHLVLTGDPKSCGAIIDPDAQWDDVAVEHPYTGLAYADGQANPMLIAPSGWSFATVHSTSESIRHSRTVATVGGERQTPHRAVIHPIAHAPAAIVRRRACFLNARPFAAFQSWLQGQEDLLPWLAWRHRLLWLDEWVSDVAELLSSIGILDLSRPRPGIAGLGDRTVVLRHDVDNSRDPSYLEEEERRGIAATHAILLDRSTKFWVGRVAERSRHEAAFHYNTGRRDWMAAMLSKARGHQRDTLLPDVSSIAGSGLLSQVRRAKAAGIGISTIHRHLAFLPYPEWVDGLDGVVAGEPSVLGGSSLFRGQVLRWGRSRIDGQTATVGDWPDSQFPLWLPFRLAHAADGGRPLNCWESTSLMEPEPELVSSLLAHRTPHLSQRVVTIGFHPAHANGTTFARHGSFESFRRLLDDLRGTDVKIATLRSVYELSSKSALAA